MKRVDSLRSQLKPLEQEHITSEHVWRPDYNRNGAFRGISFHEWLQEDINVPESHPIDEAREPGLFEENDVPRVPEHQLLAGRQIVAKILADQVKKVVDHTRGQLEPQMDTEEAVAGKLPDGTRLGKVARSKAASSVRVVDSRALLAFVTEVYPEELVQQVNPAFLAALKDQVKHGTPIPGLELVEGSASYRVTPSPEAEGIVRSRLAELINGGLLALEEK